MFISQAAECAVRALLYMAGFAPDRVVSKRDICRTQGITPGFLIKIMQPLIAAGLVKSYRGVTGGFALGRPPAEISLWDIISVSGGPILLNRCLIHDGYCPRDATCPVHPVWHQAKAELERTLSRTTLASLTQQTTVQAIEG
jgi:Rrf2 family protein